MNSSRWPAFVLGIALLLTACSEHARTPFQFAKCKTATIADCEAPMRDANVVVSVDATGNVFSTMRAAMEFGGSIAIVSWAAQAKPPTVRLKKLTPLPELGSTASCQTLNGFRTLFGLKLSRTRNGPARYGESDPPTCQSRVYVSSLCRVPVNSVLQRRPGFLRVSLPGRSFTDFTVEGSAQNSNAWHVVGGVGATRRRRRARGRG